jgi:3-methyladenine DNA glycosylase AlkD
MARFGMAVEKRLGVAVPDMRKIAKETGKDHQLALEMKNSSNGFLLSRKEQQMSATL